MTAQQITKYLDSKPVSRKKLGFKRELSTLRILTLLDGDYEHREAIRRFTGRLRASAIRSQRQKAIWRARCDTGKSN